MALAPALKMRPGSAAHCFDGCSDAQCEVARDGIRRALDIDDEEVAAITEFNPIA